MDPNQTAPIEAVCSGSKLFASILNSSVMLGNYLQETTSADDIFRCIFFLGALRVNNISDIEAFFFPKKLKKNLLKMGRLLFLFLGISSGRQINRVCLNIYHVPIQIAGQGVQTPPP